MSPKNIMNIYGLIQNENHDVTKQVMERKGRVVEHQYVNSYILSSKFIIYYDQ